jgi:hypothetical protein
MECQKTDRLLLIQQQSVLLIGVLLAFNQLPANLAIAKIAARRAHSVLTTSRRVSAA